MCPWYFITNLSFLSLGHHVVQNLIFLCLHHQFQEKLCLYRQIVVPSGPATKSLVIPDGKIPNPPPISKAAPTPIV